MRSTFPDWNGTPDSSSESTGTSPRTAMPHPLFVLNGSNLNMLGTREPALYGTTTLAEIEQHTRQLADSLGLACDFRQTNHEGVLVDWIQEAATQEAAVVINPAGF